MSLSNLALSLWLGLNSLQPTPIKPESPSCESLLYANIRHNYEAEQRDYLEGKLNKLIHQAKPVCEVFLKQGIPASTIAEVPFIHTRVLSEDMYIGRVHPDWIKRFGTEDDFVKYSTDFASLDPDFGKEIDWVRNYLIDRLKNKKHVKNVIAKYSEDSNQLMKVDDIYQLFILKNYLDFFESEQGLNVIKSLFPIERNSEEKGGLLFSNNNSISFFELKNYASKEIAKGAYMPVPLANFVPNLGMLHTHPRENYSVHILAGPSSTPPNQDEFESAYSFDTGIPELFRKGRFRSMEVVVAELGNSQYNVDVYFKQVIDGKPVMFNYIVIDLGIFTTRNADR